jgi:HD-like signal output (HDOD) protein
LTQLQKKRRIQLRYFINYSTISPQLSERNTRLYWKSRCAASAASEAKLFGRIDAAAKEKTYSAALLYQLFNHQPTT